MRNLQNENFTTHKDQTFTLLSSLERWTTTYADNIREEEGKSRVEVEVSRVGKINAKKRLKEDLGKLLNMHILQSLGSMLDTVMF